MLTTEGRSLDDGFHNSPRLREIQDFRYEYEFLANLVVPDRAGGTYDGTILFVA